MSKGKVLYVDDEPINLMLFESIFGKKYEILVANNATMGLEILESNSNIGIVFSDMKMPGMNGIQFITEALKISPSIPYYIITGFEANSEINDALNKGIIKEYLLKPFNHEKIYSEIEKVFCA